VDAADLLAGIDDIPWQSLNAEEVPGLLRDLAVPSGDRTYIVDVLSDCVWNQGTVYPATPHAVPFLARFAAAGVETFSLVHLVGLIAIIEENQFCLPELTYAARQAAWSQAVVLAPVLSDPDPETRVIALWAFGGFRPASRIVPHIHERWAAERDRVVRAVLLLTLAGLDGEEAASTATDVLEHPADPCLRLIAASVRLRAGATGQDMLTSAAADWLVAGEDLPDSYWDSLYDHPLESIVFTLAGRGELAQAVTLIADCLTCPGADELRQRVVWTAGDLAQAYRIPHQVLAGPLAAVAKDSKAGRAARELLDQHCPAAARALLRIDPRQHGGVPLETLADRLADAVSVGRVSTKYRAIALLAELGIPNLPPRIPARLRQLADQDRRIVADGALHLIIRDDEELRFAIRKLLGES
jgi:hypothetical protein